MRQLYLYLAAIISTGVYSQSILDKAETGSRTVSDPHTVILAPGFHAKSDISNPFIAKIGTSTDNPTNPTNNNAGSENPSGTVGNTSLNFHDTQGNIDVNGGGQLQYTLPIALPPGVKSVAPQINLVYTSGSGNGIAGYGWNISGITSISRVGRTIEKDGEVRGIKLDYSDYYSFNGQRLIYKSGGTGPNNIGAHGSVYTTEKYSNIKVIAIGSISGQQWQGPEYWEVTFEDGSQAWYGAIASGASDARTPIEYNIVKWKDAQGNYITYNYTQTSNVAVVSSIQWGGNETLSKPHFNEIIFTYNLEVNRVLKEFSFVEGIEFKQNKLLNIITVFTNSTIFKRYIVSYKDINNKNNYQVVDRITEESSNEQKTNAVTFGYENTASKPFSNYSFYDSGKVLNGDFDGDGKLDFIRYNKAENFCAEYQQVPQPYNDNDDQNNFYVDQCIRYESNPAGLYLHKRIFDSDKERIYIGSGNFTEQEFNNNAVAITTKGSDGILPANQGFAIYRKILNQNSKYDLSIDLYTIKDNQVSYLYSKTIENSIYDKTVTEEYPNPTGWYRFSINTSIGGINEIELDSDGISEIVIQLDDYYLEENHCFSPFPEDCPGGFPVNSYSRFRSLIINTNKDLLPENSFSVLEIFPYDQPIKNIYKTGDFNGDGKMDMLRFDSSGRPLLLEFVKNPATQLYYTVQSNFYTTPVSLSGLRSKALLGDVNGDGKTDLLIPSAEGSFDWYLYTSTGKGFVLQNLNGFSYYKPNNDYTDAGRAYYYIRNYNLQDINQDGKADFIELFSHSRQNRHSENNFSQFDINVHENMGYLGNDQAITFKKRNIDNNVTNEFNFFSGSNMDAYPFSYFMNGKWYVTETPRYSTPHTIYPFSLVSGNFRINQSNAQILIIKNGTMIAFEDYNHPKDVRINTITQGKITTYIDYKELDPAVNPNLYDDVKKELYPFVELDKVSQSYAVSQLRQENRKQDFKYRGFLTHLQGKGMLGFRQTARSSWYADGYENTVIWSGAEMDPLNEGVPIKEWSVKTYNDNNLIFPSDISENNNQLLSYKKTDYQTDILANGVKAIVPWKTKTKDFLKNITTDSEIIYGDYYLPVQTNTSINGGFATSQTIMTYSHNPLGTGKDYYIGRPKSKTESATAYDDTKSTEETYTYENNLLSQLVKKPARQAGGIYEDYQYDGWGNITEKKVSYKRPKVTSNPSLTQISKAQYDDKGRFVIKKTDNLGLETHITYNNWGQVETQTDPYGVVLTNTYDGWGKLLTAVVDIGGVKTFTKYTYEKLSDGGSIVTQYDPDGNISKKYTNKLGQDYKTSTKGFSQNTFVSKSSQYDPLGRKTGESEPYFGEVPPTFPDDITYDNDVKILGWNIIKYNDNTFPAKIKTITFHDKRTETTVSERTTTVRELNGNLRTTTKTTDALGNIVTSTDKGGSINFSYNAAGQQTSAEYGTNSVTTSYDDWGRKTEFHDPSNGTYYYDYDGFGRILWEASPKGYKEYAYNSFGQLATQQEQSNDGTSTNKTITYTYNSKGLVTGKTGTANGKAYSTTVTYDAYGRVISSSENNNGKYFMKKGITYDDKMRVISYEKSLYSSGVYTKVIIENVYHPWSGTLYQVKDKTRNLVLWELQNANANGLVSNAILGGSTIYNIYDSSNFLANATHKRISDNTTVLQMNYNFDAVKNELKSRIRGGAFSITESFEYDDNNRLVNWTDPVTGAFTQNAIKNTYDIKGRILNNDQVGQIKFNDNNRIYRSTGMVLNTTGQQNFNGILTQKISYNENNDPVFIDGMKGDVRFEYGLTEMRQVMTYGGNFGADGTGKYTKYYSEDGSYEVVRNNQTGQEKHLIYIGGTPYESNIVYLKNYTQSSGSYKFLHKDYLGSILAITDESGYAVEQRHYDAWGNFTHLKIAGATVDPNNVGSYEFLLDRGYTSHEHLAEVGLIHMNGRLYDPLLRRFLNADENIQDMFNTQNYNKYGYVLNNPLIYADPSGEFIFTLLAVVTGQWWALPIAIGADLGAYNGLKLGQAQGATGLKLFGYVLGGAAIGAASSYASISIAAASIPFSSTLSIMAGSFSNSVGMYFLSGGKTPISMSFGVGSYNFSSNEWGYLGKKGNSFMENFGYFMGAMANLSDTVSFIKGGGENINVNSAETNKDDWWGHSSITKEKNGDSLISVGPESQVQKSTNSLSETWKNSIKDAKTDWNTYINEKGTWSVKLNNISTKAISDYGAGITRWDLLLNSCVGHTSRALWAAGVPNIYFFHPIFLNAQLFVRQIGIYASPYLYQIPKN